MAEQEVLIEEVWKWIDGYEGDYAVSTFGNIRTYKPLAARCPRPESPRPLIPRRSSPYGHVKVGLCDGNGGRKYSFVHKLVMAAFVGPRPDGIEIRHLDGDPTNNALSNLAYGTHVENMKDRSLHGRTYRPLGELSKNTTLTQVDIVSIRGMITQGMNDCAIGRAMGVGRSSIRNIRIGKTWGHV